jgi:hypothetical protein
MIPTGPATILLRQLIPTLFRIPLRSGTPWRWGNAQDVAIINLPLDSQTVYVHSS